MGLAAAARKIAAAQIGKFGNPVTYTRTTGGTYSAATGRVTGGSTAEYGVRALWQEYRASQVDGSTVHNGDRKAVLAASALEAAGLSGEPQPGDTLTAGGVSFAVVRLERAEMLEGSAVLYTVQVRR